MHALCRTKLYSAKKNGQSIPPKELKMLKIRKNFCNREKNEIQPQQTSTKKSLRDISWALVLGSPQGKQTTSCQEHLP